MITISDRFYSPMEISKWIYESVIVITITVTELKPSAVDPIKIMETLNTVSFRINCPAVAVYEYYKTVYGMNNRSMVHQHSSHPHFTIVDEEITSLVARTEIKEGITDISEIVWAVY